MMQPIALSIDACVHDLQLLLYSAPESVKNAFFDDDVAFRGRDVALRKAEWCDTQARGASEYDARFYHDAALLLRIAAPSLPEHAPPEPRRMPVDEDYSRSVAAADRRYRRRGR